MILKIKRLHPKAVAPFYATPGAAGLDLHYMPTPWEEDWILAGELAGGSPMMSLSDPFPSYRLPTGIAIEIPPGFEGTIRPRGSWHDRLIYWHHGTIDSDYRGELIVCFVPSRSFQIAPGERIAQLVISPVERVHVEWAEELSRTDRSEGRFGSTGRM